MIADDRFLKENPLIKEIVNKSIFMKFFSPPPIIIKTFGDEWIQQVESIVGKVQANHYLFPDIAESIKNLSKVKCFEKLKEKLLKIDSEFFQLLSQLEFSSYIVGGLVDSAELEYCFSTRNGKHPDLRIKINDEWYYFELTKVMEYREQNLLIKLNDILFAFLNGLNLDRGISFDLSVSFMKDPTEELCKDVLNTINKMTKLETLTEQAFENYVVSFKNGKGLLDISIPKVVGYNKIKDKFISEYEQFDNGETNIILLDITSLIGQAVEYTDVIQQLFRDYKDDRITAVILASKRFIIESNEILHELEIIASYNEFVEDSRTKAEIVVKAIIQSS